nr:membrane protein [Lentzea albidocapillata]
MPDTRQGPGRMLVTVYGIFAIAATSRSAVQIATRFSDAPVAYTLSALAAVVYVLATVALALDSRRIAFIACSVELGGVLLVGAASLVVPQAFPDATVWSFFGLGYGFIPLVLPILGLWWLRRTA